MPVDSRYSKNDGRESDDWLGSGELDWGESPTRTGLSGSFGRTARAPDAGDDWPPPHVGAADDATIRRRRLIALVAGLAVLGAIIVFAVVAFGGSDGSSTANETPPPATTPSTP